MRCLYPVSCRPRCLPTACLSAQSEVLRNTPAGDKEKVSKTMHRVMDHNQLFYCTNTEIVVGDMPKTNMDPIHAEVKRVYLLISIGLPSSKTSWTSISVKRFPLTN